LERSSLEYQRRKLAWELCQSKAWKEFLQPILESKASSSISMIEGLDSAFRAAKEQTEIDYAKWLLSHVERKANEFTKTQVTPE